MLLSDRLRHRLRVVLNRALGKPRYDYRKVWHELTERTSGVESIEGLCSVIARAVSEIFGVADVSVWLYEESRNALSLGGSTALSAAAVRPALESGGEADSLIELMKAEAGPLDLLDGLSSDGNAPGFMTTLRIRYAVALTAGRRFLGIVTESLEARFLRSWTKNADSVWKASISLACSRRSASRR